MKKVYLLLVLFFAAASTYAGTADYFVNDDQVETTLNEAIQIDFSTQSATSANFLDASMVQAADPNPWVAFVLAWVVGWTGIHRVYLGGKGSLIAIYVVTCGGIFGIVPLIDWIVLLIGAAKNDISQFVGNDSFFMWK
ncbi:MAG: TM2 domain-containing protein [Cyclobacteriaceae bacterium]|nr:TM2 domain-containing protein [Cyclobacteriaceae bacterium]